MLLAVHLHEIKGFHDFEQQGNILNAVLKPSPWNNENLQCFSSLEGTLSSLTARQTFSFLFHSLWQCRVMVFGVNSYSWINCSCVLVIANRSLLSLAVLSCWTELMTDTQSNIWNHVHPSGAPVKGYDNFCLVRIGSFGNLSYICSWKLLI